jgi:hypothetical protein
MNAVQPFLLGEAPWTEIRDGHLAALTLFGRHYSALPYRDGRDRRRFVGPGFRMVLLTPDARALFCWRKFKSLDHQEGVNCAVFRNEGSSYGRSSDLITAAMGLAWTRWPGERLYTYVNAKRVASPNPGFCFKSAGWSRCGTTATRKLHILECRP